MYGAAFEWSPVDDKYAWEADNSIARNSALRRAARALAAEEIIDIAVRSEPTLYRPRTDEATGVQRDLAVMRFPEHLPLAPITIDENSEVAGHFEGLAEALDGWADLTDAYLVSRELPIAERNSAMAAQSSREHHLKRRMDYHRAFLDQLPIPVGAFCWQWAFAQWLIARGDLTALRAKQDAEFR